MWEKFLDSCRKCSKKIKELEVVVWESYHLYADESKMEAKRAFGLCVIRLSFIRLRKLRGYRKEVSLYRNKSCNQERKTDVQELISNFQGLKSNFLPLNISMCPILRKFVTAFYRFISVMTIAPGSRPLKTNPGGCVFIMRMDRYKQS